MYGSLGYKKPPVIMYVVHLKEMTLFCNIYDAEIVSKSRLKTGSVEKEEVNDFLE